MKACKQIIQRVNRLVKPARITAIAISTKDRHVVSDTSRAPKPKAMSMSGSSLSASAAVVPSRSTSSVDDNPCWGGPEPKRHDLEYLLRVLGSKSDTAGSRSTISSTSTSTSSPASISFVPPENYTALIQRVHEKLIIYQDDDFMAIHKPADLRMDGPHRATVHKLLLYLFPPPSLEKMVLEELNKNKSTEGTEVEDEIPAKKQMEMRHKQLLKSISPLAKHNLLKDDPFRMAHQLDYATSGVLLMGKAKKATGVASQAFEERKTNKQYVAVAINPSSTASPSSNDREHEQQPPFTSEFVQNLPLLPKSSLDSSWGDMSLEKQYRKKRERESDTREGKRGTFNGYMPPHSVYDKWRAVLTKEKKGREEGSINLLPIFDNKEPAPKKFKKKKRNGQDDLPPLPPSPSLSGQEIDEVLSIGQSFKKFKTYCATNNKPWKTIVDDLTKEYNELLVEHIAKKKRDFVASLDGNGQKGAGGGTPNAVLPPLFRIENEGSSQESSSFYISASIGKPNDDRFTMIVDPSVSNQAEDESAVADLRPSLTKCTILWRGYMHGNDGERIPVSKVLLQPRTGRRHQLRVHLARVLGFPILGDVAYGGQLNAGSDERGDVCSRMCLHAKQLSIPLFGDETKLFVAPDPFVPMKGNGSEEESLVIL